MKHKQLIVWPLAYGLTMFITYLAGYAYWEIKRAEFWSCYAMEPNTCDVLKPDGPMGMVLFVFIPFGVSLLFSTVFLVSDQYRRRHAKK